MTKYKLSVMKLKVRIYFLLVGLILIYVAVISFSDFFHNHPIDGRTRDHCPACAIQIIINADFVPEVMDLSSQLPEIEYSSVFLENNFYIQESDKLNFARAPPLLVALFTQPYTRKANFSNDAIN